MNVIVGSGNPVKVRAVERALASAGYEPHVTGVAVDSGVSEQPYGDAETREGARNRARAAFDGCDLAVGIEGGVAPRDGGLWLVMHAAVTDGDDLAYGEGPALRLPDAIAARVEAGEELGPVMDDVLGEDDVAKKQGAAGALTGGIIDRESALRHAVAGALGPFVTEHY
ncbi:inosine/xanthosine triphosphatase [Natronomonas sp. EA1]|uniref:inosine/xanthosine triphosphatase n=1 Tax=Natronomonas sp. EA1 TaxID=3421655 RepID=UPI003EBF5341